MGGRIENKTDLSPLRDGAGVWTKPECSEIVPGPKSKRCTIKIFAIWARRQGLVTTTERK